MVLWDSGSPSSQSAGFPSKVTVLCPDNSSRNLLACHRASSIGSQLQKDGKTDKGKQPEYSLEVRMLKLRYFGYLMQRATSLEKTLIQGEIESKKRRGWQRMRWLDCITDSMDMNLS